MVDYSQYYNNDYDDITVHYRIYRSHHDEQLTVICVQNFDYPDYNSDRFVSAEYYLYEDEAWREVKIMSNPDLFIPRLYELHYRLYEKSADEVVILEISSDYDYQDYDEDKFVNDIFYRDFNSADSALFYLT